MVAPKTWLRHNILCDSFDALVISKKNIFDAFLQPNDILEISAAWVMLGYAKRQKLHAKVS